MIRISVVHGMSVPSELARAVIEMIAQSPEYQFCTSALNGNAGAPADTRRIDPPEPPHVTLLVADQVPLPDVVGMLERLRSAALSPVIVIREAAGPSETVELLHRGAADFIAPPVRWVDVMPRIHRLLVHLRDSDNLVGQLKQRLGLQQFVGDDPGFVAEIRKIPLLAACDSSVLIAGETGTGKELCARAIHYLGPRSARPFVPINCGAVPVELLENELFGHESGAYTGAAQRKRGLLQEAEGGTLFLDEIDTMPPGAQVKLLRVLQDKEFRQLGSTELLRADVRIIAATNASVADAVRRGTLRSDLYYRLNTLPLCLPPLRERRGDIPLLANHFLAKFTVRFARPGMQISPAAMQRLFAHDWPGNLRELEHVIERAVVLSQEPVIRSADLVLPGLIDDAPESFRQAKAAVIRQFERHYLQRLLAANHGNITRAAEAACKNRRAFWQLLRKHGIDVQGYKSAPAT